MAGVTKPYWVHFNGQRGAQYWFLVVGQGPDETIEGFLYLTEQVEEYGNTGVIYLRGIGRGDGPTSWQPRKA